MISIYKIAAVSALLGLISSISTEIIPVLMIYMISAATVLEYVMIVFFTIFGLSLSYIFINVSKDFKDNYLKGIGFAGFLIVLFRLLITFVPIFISSDSLILFIAFWIVIGLGFKKIFDHTNKELFKQLYYLFLLGGILFIIVIGRYLIIVGEILIIAKFWNLSISPTLQTVKKKQTCHLCNKPIENYSYNCEKCQNMICHNCAKIHENKIYCTRCLGG